MRRPFDTKPIIFATVEHIVYQWKMADGWQKFPFDREGLADLAVLAVVEELEDEDAVLIAGPTEFEIEDKGRSEVPIGWAVEQVLKLQGMVGVSLPLDTESLL